MAYEELKEVAMPVDSAVWAALIGAVSGIASAFLTTKFTTSASRQQALRVEEKDAAYLTSQVAPALRQYAETCLLVTHDDGYDEGRRAGANDCAEAVVKTPTFSPKELTVEWKSLDSKLMLEILTFPDLMTPIVGVPSGDYDDPPDYEAYFLDRQRRHASLGLYALDLVKRLHASLRHEQSHHVEELTVQLQERKAKLEMDHFEREMQILAAHERMRGRAPFVPDHLAL